MDAKRIGIITTSVPLFSSGLVQNAFFIYQTLTKAGNDCDLLAYSSEFKLSYKDISVKPITQKVDDFDYENYKILITVGNGITKEMYLKCKSHGLKVIGFICGNVLPMHMAAFIDETNKSSIVTKSQPVDKLWIIDSFSYMKTYVELFRGAPALTVPHLWSPCLIEDAVIHRFKKEVKDIEYSPKRALKINILIIEPNIDFVKNAIIPLMAAEKLHQTYPELINEVYLFNFPEHKNAHAIIDNLTVRPKIRIFKSQHIGIVLLHFNQMDIMPIFASHQILTPWNYLYYELMYFGFPLVHNSDLLKSYCYFYPEYDIDLCASQIKKAFDSHNENYEEQTLKNKIYLDGINPEKTSDYWNHLLK
jgi:hypothetical protein